MIHKSKGNNICKRQNLGKINKAKQVEINHRCLNRPVPIEVCWK